MILLDTNVISELMLTEADSGVLHWFADLPREEVATTAVCAAELFKGIATMPEGAKRTTVAELVSMMLDVELAGRIHPFDADAALEFAEVFSTRKALGRPVSYADAQIASIARVHHATIATRNTRDFEYAGIEVVNPWIG
ncbi:type II toxin-antitoxin system VapC family toxin [Herbiconiux sp.]|uniref:type II toxin-antitoxin system VapC family toxin n=1 Tax=Herbiconiux sp. TaxID=1871186 RepID=UPI0025C03420|nr:type II toxin-antitoxin system VapC family toxin [Herbiconiux sp.]